MDSIKKVKLETINLKKSKTSNSSYNAKVTEIEDVNTAQLTSSKINEQSAPVIANSLIEAMPLLNEETALNMANQLINYGFSNEEIKNITAKRNQSGDIVLTCQNGDRLFFETNGQEYIFESIIKSYGEHIRIKDIKKNIDGYEVTFFLTEEEQKKIKENTLIKDTSKINGYVDLTINGHNTKVYWVGDMSQNDFIKRVKLIDEQMNNYPQKIVDTVFSQDDFRGFYIGNNSEITNPELNNSYAFASSGLIDSIGMYIYFMNIPLDDDTFRRTINHEFTHVADRVLGKLYGPNCYYSESDSTMKKLYEKYKKIVQPLIAQKDNGFGNEKKYPDGVPNSKEFLASISEIYLTSPDELKKTIPELYECMETLFK